MSEQHSTSAATVSSSPPQTSTWTRYLPEKYGIRQAIENSPYKWCVRESVMWGIATSTAMGLHRIRMKTHPSWVFFSVLGTMTIVTFPSYYFCHKRRDHKEQMIEMMMKANDFQHSEEMPEPIPKEEHPFLDVEGERENEDKRRKEFVARLKEKKEWQKQHPMTDFFQQPDKKKNKDDE